MREGTHVSEQLQPRTPAEIRLYLSNAVMQTRKFELMKQHIAIFGSTLQTAKDAIDHVMPFPYHKQTTDDNIAKVIQLFSERIPELLDTTDTTMEQLIIEGVTTAVNSWRAMGYKSPAHAAAAVVKNYAIKQGYVHGEVWSADACHASA